MIGTLKNSWHDGYGMQVEQSSRLLTWIAPSICDVCTWPLELKVQEIFSTISTKISSRALPSVLLVSRMDFMTPVGPLPTPENRASPLLFCHIQNEQSIVHCVVVQASWEEYL